MAGMTGAFPTVGNPGGSVNVLGRAQGPDLRREAAAERKFQGSSNGRRHGRADGMSGVRYALNPGAVR